LASVNARREYWHVFQGSPTRATRVQVDFCDVLQALSHRETGVSEELGLLLFPGKGLSSRDEGRKALIVFHTWEVRLKST